MSTVARYESGKEHLFFEKLIRKTHSLSSWRPEEVEPFNRSQKTSQRLEENEQTFF